MKVKEMKDKVIKGSVGKACFEGIGEGKGRTKGK